MLDLVLTRGRPRLAQERARWVREDHHPRLAQKPGAGLPLKLAPQLVRATHQRHVLPPFPDRKASHARLPVGRAPRMRRNVLVDPNHRHAAGGQLAAGSAAHRAQPNHDHLGLANLGMIALERRA